MKNVTLHRTTILQFDVDATDSALDAAADCDVLRNNAPLDLRAIADQEIRGAQLALDSAEHLSWTITFDVTNDRHARADARGRSRFWHRRARGGLFNNRVLLLHHPPDDFGRICYRVLILLGCLAFEEHVHLRFRRHAVQEGPKGCRTATSRKRRAFRLGCRLRIGLRKPELPLRWSPRVRAIPCTVPCQGFHFPTIRASHHPFELACAISLSAAVLCRRIGTIVEHGERKLRKSRLV